MTHKFTHTELKETAYPPKEESCVMEPEDATAQAVTLQKRNIAFKLRGILDTLRNGQITESAIEINRLATELEKP